MFVFTDERKEDTIFRETPVILKLAEEELFGAGLGRALLMSRDIRDSFNVHF